MPGVQLTNANGRVPRNCRTRMLMATGACPGIAGCVWITATGVHLGIAGCKLRVRLAVAARKEATRPRWRNPRKLWTRRIGPNNNHSRAGHWRSHQTRPGRHGDHASGEVLHDRTGVSTPTQNHTRGMTLTQTRRSTGTERDIPQPGAKTSRLT